MNDRLSVQYAEKPLHVSTIGNDTRDFTRARRSLFVVVTLRLAGIGGAHGGLPEPMHWDAISVPRPEECVFDHY